MSGLRFRSVFGVLGAVLLWASVCQARTWEGLSRWVPQNTASHKAIRADSDAPIWSYRITATDLALGYDRPWYAKTHTMDPDFSAAYAVGGGFNVLLSPATTLSTSLQFLWRKIDENGQRAVSHSSGLAGFNIRAVNLVIGIQARF